MQENSGLMLMAGPRQGARAGTGWGGEERRAGRTWGWTRAGGGGGWYGSVGRDDRDGEGEEGWPGGEGEGQRSGEWQREKWEE